MKYKDTNYSEIVSLLIQNKSIGIFQGRSEGGPRSLGNRSIIFNPSHKNGKDLINKVKKREKFRPFAATILKEHVEDWFYVFNDLDYSHMSFCVPCKEEKIQKIPAVLHIDNTCRIQTITKKQNEYYYEIIDNFYNKTGVPLLLNTSFNLAGYPIVETVSDCFHMIENSELDCLYFPEVQKLVQK